MLFLVNTRAGTYATLMGGTLSSANKKIFLGGGWHDNYYKIKSTKINARFPCGGRESRHYTLVMKSIKFKPFTLHIQFNGFAQEKKYVHLPFYAKASRKHPAYEEHLQIAISNAAVASGLAPSAKPSCYSLLAGMC